MITVTACSIFSALPNFWRLPTQFLTGASAAAAIALINTIGNVAGFSAGYITGAVRGVTGTYVLPMLIVGGLMLLSAILMVLLSRSGQESQAASATQEH